MSFILLRQLRFKTKPPLQLITDYREAEITFKVSVIHEEN